VTPVPNFLGLGQAACEIGGTVQVHHLRRLCDAGAIPFFRIGRMRIVKASDLERIREECKRYGYIRESEVSARA
jgi:hypothetical protein